MDDPEIITLFWARNQLAISESQKKYGSLCASIAMNILHNRQDSEECVNDTWDRAWNTIPPQRPGSLAAYFGRIVRNLALSLWRRGQAQKRGGGAADLLLSELTECLPAQPGGVLCQEEQLSGLISRWLCALPEEDRVIFLRRYWYGDPLSALAKARGTSAGHLAVRMHRLREKLRAFLEEEGITI